jgi:hypothetical protein
VEERELALRRHDEQAVGLRDAARDLGEELRACDTNGDREAGALEDVLRSRTAISTGEPAIRCIPRTSRNASSIEIPSTNGDVSWNTSNTALLASLYADMRGGTTIACGHSRRAWAPPIAVRTP